MWSFCATGSVCTKVEGIEVTGCRCCYCKPQIYYCKPQIAKAYLPHPPSTPTYLTVRLAYPSLHKPAKSTLNFTILAS